MPTLEDVRRAVSPRFAPPPTPLRSVLIHGGVTALWLALLARACIADGPFAWSTGLVYVGYDTFLLLFVMWHTLPLARRRPAATRSPAAIPLTLGVIVAAHNEAAVLPQTLAALLAQSDPPAEILIADDGSTDGTALLLAERYGLVVPPQGGIGGGGAAYPTLRWLRLAHGGKARALNAAIAAIGTDVVMTVDADTLPDHDAIAAMRRAFAADPALVAATGLLAPECGPRLDGRVLQWFQTYEYVRNFLSRYAWMGVDGLLLISGAFAGYRRAAVLSVGGFDPGCLVEDYELIHRLRRGAVQRGLTWRTAVLGEARARTDAPATIPAFLRQRRRWFGGFLQTQWWYRDMVGDARYGRLGTLMLPVKAMDMLQPIYGLTAFALLLVYLATGRLAVALPVGGVIGAKILLDFALHLWFVHLYRGWSGGRTRATLGAAFLAALAEPFSFKLLRHGAAAWGWVTFLTGQGSWERQRRQWMPAPAES
jgi:cellulose synthase/poly-beta-1,6-N-acetylglucosamine synthase-like glycosyltransferase